MFKMFRYKLANRLVKRAGRLIETGDFKNIKKGLRYFKWSVMVIPPNSKLREIGEQLRKEAAEESRKLFSKRG